MADRDDPAFLDVPPATIPDAPGAPQLATAAQGIYRTPQRPTEIAERAPIRVRAPSEPPDLLAATAAEPPEPDAPLPRRLGVMAYPRTTGAVLAAAGAFGVYLQPSIRGPGADLGAFVLVTLALANGAWLVATGRPTNARGEVLGWWTLGRGVVLGIAVVVAFCLYQTYRP